MRTLYVVRHGRTEDTEQGLVSGHRDPSLTPHGMRDASRAAVRLQGVKFTAVCSSDLQRALLTAREIRNRAEITAPLKISRLLREINYGLAEGMPKPLVQRRYARAYDDPKYPFPRGESFADVCARVNRFVARLPKNGKFLLVTHAGVIRALQVLYEGVDPVAVRKRTITNGSVRIIRA